MKDIHKDNMQPQGSEEETVEFEVFDLDFLTQSKPDFLQDPIDLIKDWVSKTLPEDFQQTFVDMVVQIRKDNNIN